MNNTNIIKSYKRLVELYNILVKKNDDYDTDEIISELHFNQLMLEMNQAIDIIMSLQYLVSVEKPMDETRKEKISKILNRYYIDRQDDFIDKFGDVIMIIQGYINNFSKLPIIRVDFDYFFEIIKGFTFFFKKKFQMYVRPEAINLLKIFDSDKHFVDSLPVCSFSIYEKVFILKPRKAEIDSTIIKLFNSINKVNKRQLPTYNIIQHPDTNINYSLWDFIHTTEQENTAFNYLCNSNLSLKDLNQRKNNLIFLNTVAKRIGLTDLHRENVILNVNIFYPIDLESINYNSVTGLYGHNIGPIGRLNKPTGELINNFNYNINNIPYRIVPIETTKLLEYNNIDSGVRPTMNELLTIFQNNISQFNLRINKQKLENYINQCSDNQIIPYFYKHKNNIYIKGIYSNSNSTMITL